MELVVFVIALAGFGILAHHAGHDSRTNVSSQEQDLARYGMTWPRPTPDEELATELQVFRMRRQCPGRTRTAIARRRRLVSTPVRASIDPCR